MSEELMQEIAKELAVKTYEDTAQPTLKATGEILELIPRAIRAALAPVEEWILHKEYQVKKVDKLLKEKLKNIPPEQIESPEPYIAVPALQAISYCMDNNELRDMYANLLASSMNKIVRDGVHPSYVEIIRQLCPDEAKILRHIAMEEYIPTISVYYGDASEGNIRIVKDFSDVGYIAQCERPLDICKYLGNLSRLGLIEIPDSSQTLHYSIADTRLYEPLENHTYIQSLISNANIPEGVKNTPEIVRNYASITDYGRGFCAICLNTKTESKTPGEKAVTSQPGITTSAK